MIRNEPDVACTGSFFVFARGVLYGYVHRRSRLTENYFFEGVQSLSTAEKVARDVCDTRETQVVK